MLRNGWLHTGDLGREDRDGLIFFVDRQKDMVKPGGENVYSIEVEAVPTSHPAVVECAVIGVPDDRWGEAVKAVVVARGYVTAEELDRWCFDRLAAFKRPRWYDFVAGLPRNATAKVVKPDLRAAHDPATSTRLPERTWLKVTGDRYSPASNGTPENVRGPIDTQVPPTTSTFGGSTVIGPFRFRSARRAS